MILYQLCSLVHLADAFAEIGILVADIPDELLELLSLNPFHCVYSGC
jgi:hypothetical protein